MNANRQFVIFGVVFSMLFAVTKSQAEIKIPNLNPFAKKSTVPDVPQKAEPKSSPISLPKLPSISLFPKKKPGQPSTLEKMNRGTKAFFTKTADVLNPFNDKPAEKMSSRRGVTGSQSYFTSNSNSSKKSEKKSSFFPFSIPSPFKSKDPKPENDYEKPSVNDFLRQPRVPIE